MRIEFSERYLDMSDDEIDTARNLKQALVYSYRLIYPHLDDILYPMQAPKMKNHCIILFRDNTEICVKGNYQDICIKLDDRESQDEERRKLEQSE